LFISLNKNLIKLILLTLFFLILNREPLAAGKFEDTEKYLMNFEIYFLKNEHKKAMAEFNKFATALSAGNKEAVDKNYGDIHAVYSVFINYVSSFRANENIADAKENNKINNGLFTLFFQKYASLLKKQRALARTRESSPDLVSYIEELNKNEISENDPAAEDNTSISAEFESSMKNAALIRFISGRPLFLFMLYKNIKETGNDFQASFLKSLISKNIPDEILAVSGFPEFTGGEPALKKEGCAVFDASLMRSFNYTGNKAPSAAAVSAAMKNKTLKKADLSNAASVIVVFSKYCFYFDIARPALTKISNAAPDSAIIELQNGKKIEIRPKKFDGVFSETAFLKNCRKIKYNGMNFYSCPESAHKTFLMNAGSDFMEIIFMNFDSGVEAQAILNSFKTL